MIDKVDVTIATKNNEDTIGRCIECIKKNVPYNNIIVIDDSEDRTPQIAEKLGAIVYQGPALLGAKRYLQAELSETEWIASIDSDVFLFDNWWPTMSKHIQDDVGMITSCLEGTIKKDIPSFDHFTKWNSLKAFNKTKRASNMAMVLIRKDIILSCKKVREVHVAEDEIIAEHVLENGYKCVLNKEIVGLHYHKNPVEHTKMSYKRMGKEYIDRGLKLKNIANILLQPFLITINCISYVIHTRKMHFKLYVFLIQLYYETLKGISEGLKTKYNHS